MATTGSLKTELADAAVAGQQDRASLIATANEPEQQIRGIEFKGQISELIDDQKLCLANCASRSSMRPRCDV